MLNINSTEWLKKFLKYSNKKIPKKIKSKSEIEQIRQTINTYCFFNPCSITNIFCAPIARIKLSPVIKPSIKKSIINFFDL